MANMDDFYKELDARLEKNMGRICTEHIGEQIEEMFSEIQLGHAHFVSEYPTFSRIWRYVGYLEEEDIE